jgi:prepilin-type processing-associated H-X9-DG protein
VPPLLPGGLPHLSETFLTEGELVQPSLTPTFSDGIDAVIWPAPTEGPPFDPNGFHSGGMKVIAISRHGKHPGKLPHTWPANLPLPGAINISLFDGHVEQVPLDNLWHFQWNKLWKIPGKRPGLP